MEQELIKSEFKALFKETKAIYKEAVEKAKNGELEASEVDKLTKIISALKNLREVGYLIFDVETNMQKKEYKLKEIELGIKLNAKGLEVVKDDKQASWESG